MNNEGNGLSKCQDRFRPYTVEGTLIAFCVMSEIGLHGKCDRLPEEIELVAASLHAPHCNGDRCPGVSGAVKQIVAAFSDVTAGQILSGKSLSEVARNLRGIRRAMYERYERCLIARLEGRSDFAPTEDMKSIQGDVDEKLKSMICAFQADLERDARRN